MKFLGEQLIKYRKAKGWSGTKLSEESGVSQGNISLYENNNANPSLETVNKLGQALGVDPLVFYRGDLVPVTDQVLLHVPSNIKDVLVREDIVPYLKLTKQAIEDGIPAADMQKIYETYAELLRKTSEKTKENPEVHPAVQDEHGDKF